MVVMVVDGCWAVGGGWLGGRRWAMGGGDQRTKAIIVVAIVVGAPALRLGYLHVGGTVAVAVHVHVRVVANRRVSNHLLEGEGGVARPAGVVVAAFLNHHGRAIAVHVLIAWTAVIVKWRRTIVGVVI